MPKTYRNLSLRLSAEGPATLDDKTRSFDVTCATENEVTVFDWERFEPIKEVLLMSGISIPENRQIPLLDTHDRYSTSSVIGSCRNLKIVGGDLVGRAYFADAPEAESPWAKTRDGHITDFSIGYSIDESHWVPEGEMQTISGRQFKGPVRVATKWKVKELSVCPIGADEKAKARAEWEKTNQQARDNNPAPDVKETVMEKWLRDFLESRGLSKDATEDQARAFLQKLDIPKKEEGKPQIDVEELARKAIEIERARVSEIDAIGRQFDCVNEVRAFIADGSTIDAVRTKVLEIIAERKKGDKPLPHKIEIGLESGEKFRAAGSDALMIRAGIHVEKAAPGAHDLAGYSLRELARHALILAGQPAGGSPLEMVGRAMTVSDFPNLMANVANKSLLSGYENAPETWATWCGIGSLSDFKTASLIQTSETDDLDQVAEGQPYEYGSMLDAKEQVTMAKYGKLFAITREAIINDDLGGMTSIPMLHGEAAARKVGDIAYAILTTNANMRDSVALFHANHGNLGTSGVISETTVGEAIKLAKLQKNLKSKQYLNIRLQFFIAPAAIEGACEIFFNSGQFSGSGVASTRTNPYAGTRFTRVYDARLDASSSTAFYFAGMQGKTVTVFFLNGNRLPYLETKQGWSVDGVEYKVRMEAAAKAVDWKALVKNAGA